ncbi:hypothetical protein ACJX0J_034744 [Zea mays]
MNYLRSDRFSSKLIAQDKNCRWIYKSVKGRNKIDVALRHFYIDFSLFLIILDEYASISLCPDILDKIQAFTSILQGRLMALLEKEGNVQLLFLVKFHEKMIYNNQWEVIYFSLFTKIHYMHREVYDALFKPTREE